PDPAIPPADKFQALLVARPVLEAREFQVLLGGPALAGYAEWLHLGGGFLQQAELVARVLLGTQPTVDAGVAGISRSQSIAITFLMKSSASSGYMSMKPRPGTCPTGIVSTMNTIFSRGSRITIFESE